MGLEVIQKASLQITSGKIVMFSTDDDSITDTINYNESNSAVVKLPDGTLETELIITGMEFSDLMYLKSDKAIKFKAVAPGGVAGSTTEYTLTPNIATFLGFKIEKLYVKNDSGADAELIQGYVGQHV